MTETKAEVGLPEDLQARELMRIPLMLRNLE